MDTARVFVFVDGMLWSVSGVAWYIAPRLLGKHWLGAAEADSSSSTLDMTRGFGVALVQGAVTEVYAAVAQDTSRGILDCLMLTRLTANIVLLCGWLVFHTSTFYERFGYWGTLIALVVPVGYIAAMRV